MIGTTAREKNEQEGIIVGLWLIIIPTTVKVTSSAAEFYTLTWSKKSTLRIQELTLDSVSTKKTANFYTHTRRYFTMNRSLLRVPSLPFISLTISIIFLYKRLQTREFINIQGER